MNYEDMLKKGRKELPESVLKKERFEVPKVTGHIQGNKTIITNFNQIAQVLHREPEQVLKFVLKEIASPGELTNQGVIIGRKVNSGLINEKIDKYVKTFIMCPECNRPDTQLKKEGNIVFMKCLACGAKHPVKA